MQWSKVSGRCGHFLVMTVMLVTLTAGFPTTMTEPTMWPPEPNCSEGYGNTNICACDAQCAMYGDCCRSSPYFVPEEQHLGASPFQCKTLFKISMYVIMTCPPDWKDSDTRNRCEHPDTNYSDPLFDAPVTSYSTNITYRNWHCASCHRDLDANTTAIWESQFKCNIADDMPFLSVSGETFTDYLSYDAYNSQWNFNIDRYHLDRDPGIFISDRPGMQQRYNYQCDLVFIPQPDELRTFRFCRTDIITECSSDWIATEEEKQCNAYTAYVCSGYNTYRNQHCFLCNNFTTLEPCEPSTPSTPSSEAERLIPTFSMLLDWKRLKRSVCTSSEIYDPLARVCRKVFP